MSYKPYKRVTAVVMLLHVVAIFILAGVLIKRPQANVP